MNISTAAE